LVLVVKEGAVIRIPAVRLLAMQVALEQEYVAELQDQQLRRLHELGLLVAQLEVVWLVMEK
jgi:hypothetical protein